MASNPMQRKARLSFLIGVLVTLLVTGIIIGFLVVSLANQVKAQKAEQEKKGMAYVLTADVKSGQPITADFCDTKEVDKTTIPSNYLTADSMDQLSLQDKQGRPISVSAETDKSGNSVVKITMRTDDGKTVNLLQDDATGNYYYENEGQKQVVELNSIPLVAKVDLKANTVLTTDLVDQGDNTTADDVREQEYNVVTLPTELETGDYIDIRLRLPDGTDFIVVSKKSVTIPETAGGPIANTIRMNEDETLYMGSAIIDHFLTSGSTLYAVKYTEPGLQNDASNTYIPSSASIDLIKRDPNILETLKNTKFGLSSEGALNADAMRSRIDAARNSEIETLQEKVTSSTENSQAARQEYLNSLAGE